MRVDTFDKPKAEQVFYVGTNDPEQLNEIRRRLLSECSELPEMGEYMHQSWFDGADRYCKDTFLLIKYLGTDFLPRLYRIKAALDRWFDKIRASPIVPLTICCSDWHSGGQIIYPSECVSTARLTSTI